MFYRKEKLLVHTRVEKVAADGTAETLHDAQRVVWVSTAPGKRSAFFTIELKRLQRIYPDGTRHAVETIKG